MRTHTHIKSTPTHSVRPQIHTHTRTHKAFTNSSPTHPARNHTHTHTYIHSRMHACIHTKSSERPSHHPPPLFIRPSSLWRLTLSSPSLSISPRFFLIPSFKTVLLHKTLRMSQRTEKESKTKKVQTVHPPPLPLHPISFSFSFLVHVSHLFCPQVSNLVESLWIVPCGPSQRVGQGASPLPPLGL